MVCRQTTGGGKVVKTLRNVGPGSERNNVTENVAAMSKASVNAVSFFMSELLVECFLFVEPLSSTQSRHKCQPAPRLQFLLRFRAYLPALSILRDYNASSHDLLLTGICHCLR